MTFKDLSCAEFVGVLASKAAVPGGGGASALVGSVGAALCSMVGNLTAGKKKYEQYWQDISKILEKADSLQQNLLELADKDAEVFEPLAKAYSIPKEEPEREQIMEEALKLACSVPIEIMRECCKAIELHNEISYKGSVIAISDVGVGVICCKSALMGASLNVFINTKSMKNREYAASIEKEADFMLDKYCRMADDVYASVLNRLR